MLEVTGDAKYAEIAEIALYNSVLSGISLDGKKYFYTNPLRISADLPYTLRWPKERLEYISCFCCPPNTLRTVCEAQNYAYTTGTQALYCQLYGASRLQTTIAGVGDIVLSQKTQYPWDGSVTLTIESLKKSKKQTTLTKEGKKASIKNPFTLYLRVPEWCKGATLRINGEEIKGDWAPNSYASVERVWKQGDVVEWHMPMEVKILEAHPLAEEIRNQVCVKRGPIVYCLESQDLPSGVRIDDVQIPSDIRLTPEQITIEGSPITALTGNAIVTSQKSWENVLYREVNADKKPMKIRLIPYYAWGNRGKGEMTVWMPLAR